MNISDPATLTTVIGVVGAIVASLVGVIRALLHIGGEFKQNRTAGQVKDANNENFKTEIRGALRDVISEVRTSISELKNVVARQSDKIDQDRHQTQAVELKLTLIDGRMAALEKSR